MAQTPIFQWTEQRKRAVVLVAEDELTNEQIAAAVGVTRQSLDKWKTRDEFRAEVERLVDEFARNLQRYAIARKDRRIKAMNRRWLKMQDIEEQRGAAGLTDRHGKPVPGANTGFVVQKITPSESGMIYEYAVDTGMSAEMRALEKQAAQEAGQWTEKKELTGKDGTPLFDLDKPIRVEYVVPDED